MDFFVHLIFYSIIVKQTSILKLSKEEGKGVLGQPYETICHQLCDLPRSVCLSVQNVFFTTSQKLL